MFSLLFALHIPLKINSVKTDQKLDLVHKTHLMSPNTVVKFKGRGGLDDEKTFIHCRC